MARVSAMAGALTKTEFEQVLARFKRLSENGKRAAFMVLVAGSSFEEVETKLGVSRQLAHRWASQIYKAFCPEGWVTSQVTLPQDLMAKVHLMEEKARAAWTKSLPPARVSRRVQEEGS